MIKLVGIRSSGNNAILNWLACQVRTDQTSKYFSNCSPSFIPPKDWDVMILGYENRPLSLFSDHPIVLLLRDPFNWMASIFKKWRPPHRLKSYMKLWKKYAHEFVGDTSIIPHAVRLNYNNWFSSKRYRQDIVNHLGLHFTDDGIQTIPKGGKSSFDGRAYCKAAQRMKVLNRWEYVRDNMNGSKFVSLFDDETLSLADRIFGPPTPNLLDFLNSRLDN